MGKINDVIVEQSQKPSQLKQKFENLARQNEVKTFEKKKNIPSQVWNIVIILK